MNIKRIVWGPLLALMFLVFFAYMVANLQLFFENYLDVNKKNVFLGSLSNGVQEGAPNVVETPAVNVIQPVAQAIPEAPINARAAISTESNLSDFNNTIFEQNSETQLQIASLTKLMTAIIVLDNYNLSDTWQVSSVADSQSSLSPDVKLGDTLTINSFLQIMLIESSNRSAYALSEMIGTQNFVELMNLKAKELGLKNTFYADPTGLSSKNVSTARDLVKLTEYVIKNYPKIAEISKAKELYIVGFGKVVNTDQLIGEIPEIVCSKTGFTTTAKGCLVLAISNPKNNDYFINVVLGADDRFAEMKKLINLSNATCK